VPREDVEKVRIAARFSGDRARAGALRFALSADEGVRDSERFVVRQRLDVEHRDARSVRAELLAIEPVPERGRVAVFVAKGPHEEQRAARALAKELFEHLRAVHVAPLKVVDEEHDGR